MCDASKDERPESPKIQCELPAARGLNIRAVDQAARSRLTCLAPTHGKRSVMIFAFLRALKPERQGPLPHTCNVTLPRNHILRVWRSRRHYFRRKRRTCMTERASYLKRPVNSRMLPHTADDMNAGRGTLWIPTSPGTTRLRRAPGAASNYKTAPVA